MECFDQSNLKTLEKKNSQRNQMILSVFAKSLGLFKTRS
jgi:hypothetical protein